MRQKLNATKPQCPVGLMTLEFPSNPSRPTSVRKNKITVMLIQAAWISH